MNAIFKVRNVIKATIESETNARAAVDEQSKVWSKVTSKRKLSRDFEPGANDSEIPRQF